MFRIIEKAKVAPNITKMKLNAPLIAKKAKPGQFVILRLNETGERIPLTMAETDAEAGTITLVFQEVGKTTKRLSCLDAGNSINDLIGPLGRPAEIEKFGTVVCVGGGCGCAVIYPETKALKEAGNRVISIIGSKTKEMLVFENEMRKASDELHVCTDDGSCGHHGFVSDILKKLIDEKTKIDLVVAIGPVPMMKFICNLTRPFGIKTIVSLNSIMVDGTGMCGACRVSVGGKTKFTCVDGPEFDGHEVDFDLLSARLKMYLNEEKQSLELFEGCKTTPTPRVGASPAPAGEG